MTANMGDAPANNAGVEEETSSDQTILFAAIGGGVCCLLLCCVVVFIVLARRKKDKNEDGVEMDESVPYYYDDDDDQDDVSNLHSTAMDEPTGIYASAAGLVNPVEYSSADHTMGESKADPVIYSSAADLTPAPVLYSSAAEMQTDDSVQYSQMPE